MASKSLKQMLLGLTVVLFSFVLLSAAPLLATGDFGSRQTSCCIGIVALLVALAGLGLAAGGFNRND